MTALPIRARLPRMALAYLIFCAIYLGAPKLALFEPQLLETSSWSSFPLIPASIWIYFSIFPLLATALLLCPKDRFDYALRALLTALLLAASIYIFRPTTLPLTPAQGQGLTLTLWQVLRQTDVPTNCWPSLHVCNSLIAAWALAARGRLAATLAALWALAIAISTITTRQHILVDGIAGGILAAAALGLASSSSDSGPAKADWKGPQE